jgi:hypothetical protein
LPNRAARVDLQVGSNSIEKSNKNIDAISLTPEIISFTPPDYYTYTAVRHKKYDITNRHYDIALIKTSKPIDFVVKDNKFLVNSICLSNIDSDPVGEALLLGWGNIMLEEFQNINVKKLQKDKYILADKKKCQQLLNNSTHIDFVKEIMICTTGKVGKRPITVSIIFKKIILKFCFSTNIFKT